MRRRLLDLCLLAYPRARRERDHEYLRDLALELAETQGFLRQAPSLLRGGVRDRIEVRRRRRGAGPSVWLRRVIVAGFGLAALALAAAGLIGPAAGEGDRVELELLTCVHTDHPPSNRARTPVDGAGACAEERRLVAARMRSGWECATRRGTRDGQRAIAWRCALGRELVAWRTL